MMTGRGVGLSLLTVVTLAAQPFDPSTGSGSSRAPSRDDTLRAAPSSVEGQGVPPQPTQAQQRPVFRGGTHFVRVDAYPTKNGKIVEGLTAGDFEIFEDGKPQAIESFDFIKFNTFTPEVERRDPRTQREGFDLAADPRYRLFVIVVHVPSSGIRFVQEPLIQFLDRVLGANDLFGMLTTAQSAHDLVLGQKSVTARATIERFWHSSLMDRQPADDALDQCGPEGEAMKGRFTLDQSYVSLESLVLQLGSLRQERKNIIFVANGLPSPKNVSIFAGTQATNNLPKVGITRGRVGIGDTPDMRPGTGLYCSSEIARLKSLDFEQRFRDLLKEARRENVSFYSITPAGLQAPTTPAGMDRINANNDSLLTLAHETDGLAIVNTNDLSGGMRRIADDLSAYYVLGYYTTNTKFDGGLRTIKVKLKPRGDSIRARRQYRAPTEAEIAALSAPPRPPVPVAAAAVAQPAGPALVADPTLIVNGKPVSTLTCSRTDRVRIEWPLTGAVEHAEVHLLDRRGQRLALPLALERDVSREPHRLILDLRLAPLARGEYSVEIAATAGASRDRTLVPLRIE